MAWPLSWACGEGLTDVSGLLRAQRKAVQRDTRSEVSLSHAGTPRGLGPARVQRAGKSRCFRVDRRGRNRQDDPPQRTPPATRRQGRGRLRVQLDAPLRRVARVCALRAGSADTRELTGSAILRPPALHARSAKRRPEHRAHSRRSTESERGNARKDPLALQLRDAEGEALADPAPGPARVTGEARAPRAPAAPAADRAPVQPCPVVARADP